MPKLIAYRKRTMLRLRRELKVEKKKVKAASSIAKMPSTPEVYRTLRDHGVEVCDSVGNDDESMKGVFAFLKHKQHLHKLQGKYNKTFRLEFETFMTNLCKSMPNVANQMKSFLERKIKTETFNPLRVATACCDGIISRKVFKTLRDIYEERN